MLRIFAGLSHGDGDGLLGLGGSERGPSGSRLFGQTALIEDALDASQPRVNGMELRVAEVLAFGTDLAVEVRRALEAFVSEGVVGPFERGLDIQGPLHGWLDSAPE